MSVEADVIRQRADLITDALVHARRRLQALTPSQQRAVEELAYAVADGIARMLGEECEGRPEGGRLEREQSELGSRRPERRGPRMHLVFVGMTYHDTPVELRERAHFPPQAGALLAGRLAGRDGEAVALATCNRTELYLGHEDASAAVTRARTELRRRCGLSEVDLRRSLAVLKDEAAARHLFRVAAGLDSMAPGEAQVLGQVRRAYETARTAGGTGPVLDRAFRQAIHTGRRVRKETGIGDLGVSLGSAAVGLAERALDELEGRRILVLGAGKTARLAAVELMSRGVGAIAVANRTLERAKDLAGRLGAEALPFERITEELTRADVVIASTSSPGFVVSPGRVRFAMRQRGGRELVFIDLGVPRNVDPSVAAVPGCRLFSIDDVAAVLRETLAGRHDEFARAELLVAEEARKFSAWQRSRPAVTTITALRDRGEQLRLAKLERARDSLAGVTTRDWKIVESLTAQVVNKLLHAPTVSLRDAAPSVLLGGSRSGGGLAVPS